MEFNYFLPVNLVFGSGKVLETGELTKPYGKKALIVTGRSSAKRSGLYDKVNDSLKTAGLETVLFDKVSQNPLTTTAQEGADFAKANGCDVVVAIGGGSIMDCAKAIAFLSKNEGDINDYIYNRLTSDDALPLILIPTTCGTGSEGNGFAVLTNPDNGDKKSLRCNAIVAKVSIVDPECMMTMPKKVLASVTFDALCHNIEAYTSKIAQPLTDAMSIYAIELIANNLVSVYNGTGSKKEWENITMASTIGGMVINTAGVTIAHGMEHPASGLKDIVHGQGLAALTPIVIEASYKGNEEKFAKIAKIMLPKDYLAYRLSGSFCTDVSDASGMLLLDVKNRCWSKEMMEICDVKEEQLPKLYESWEVVGTLKPEVAEELGFSADVKVVAGAGDNAAAAVGTGTVGDGQCNISLGTSGTIFISSKNFGVDENNALHSFCHADGSYHLMGCMLSAASCNKWWAEEILQTKDFAAEQAPIQKLGENNVFFLPYLMGERSPHNNPDARGVFFGMSMDSTRADMTQAVLEGVAFGLRDSLEVARKLGIKIERTKICGGGAKSPLWKKIIANVMNLKVDVLEVEEGPSMGGAMLAAVGCGAYPDVETIGKKMAHVVDTVEPEEELVAKYEERYQKFKELYPALRPLF